MDLDKDIEHSFSLDGMRVKDWFFGCNQCWFQMDVGVACKAVCPNCNTRMGIYDVTENDITLAALVPPKFLC